LPTTAWRVPSPACEVRNEAGRSPFVQRPLLPVHYVHPEGIALQYRLLDAVHRAPDDVVDVVVVNEPLLPLAFRKPLPLGLEALYQGQHQVVVDVGIDPQDQVLRHHRLWTARGVKRQPPDGWRARVVLGLCLQRVKVTVGKAVQERQHPGPSWNSPASMAASNCGS